MMLSLWAHRISRFMLRPSIAIPSIPFMIPQITQTIRRVQTEDTTTRERRMLPDTHIIIGILRLMQTSRHSIMHTFRMN